MNKVNKILKVLAILILVPFYWGVDSACTSKPGGDSGAAGGSIGGGDLPFSGLPGGAGGINPATGGGGSDSSCVGPACQPTGTVTPRPTDEYPMTIKVEEAQDPADMGMMARMREDSAGDDDRWVVDPPPPPSPAPVIVVTATTTQPSNVYTFQIDPASSEEQHVVDFRYDIESDLVFPLNQSHFDLICKTDIKISAKLLNDPNGERVESDILKGHCPITQDYSCKVKLTLRKISNHPFNQPQVRDLQCEQRPHFIGEGTTGNGLLKK